MIQSLALATLTTLCVVTTHSVCAAAQNPLYVVRGTHAAPALPWWSSGESVGGTLAPASDVDGDGVRENWVSHARGARLLRGSDGAVLREIQGGISRFVLGDLNGDGWTEYLVRGDPDAPVLDQYLVISSANDQLLATWDWTASQQPNGQTYRGTAVGVIGDVNGDGFADVHCIESFVSQVQGVSSRDSVLVISGRDGAVLRRHDDRLRLLALRGDVDGDQVPDYVIDPCWEGGGVCPSSAPRTLISGASGAVLATYSALPNDAALIADLDGDGVRELGFATTSGTLAILSGATGLLLHSLPGERFQRQFLDGTFVTPTADVDGDGAQDVAIYADETLKLYSLVAAAVVADYHVGYSSAINAGDVNGDGREDLLIGLSQASEGRGKVLLATAPLDLRVGNRFAFGSSACPCGQGIATQGGCDSAPLAGPFGGPQLKLSARLDAFGSASLAARDLQFYATNVATDAGLLAEGFLLASPSTQALPTRSGNGLLALAPPFARIARMRTSWNRIHASYTPLWSTLSAGQSVHFQVWYREFFFTANDCSAGFNFTNALSITFTP